MTADATSSKNEANELRGLLLDVIIDTRLKPCVEAQEKAEKTAWDLMQDADLNATQTQRKIIRTIWIHNRAVLTKEGIIEVAFEAAVRMHNRYSGLFN